MHSLMGTRLIILSGPSCVAKSPLYKALGRFYPELCKHLQRTVLFNSRVPRPGELDGIDYHFRTRLQIEALRASARHAVLEVRGDLQALDVEQLEHLLSKGDVFFEGNPFVGRALQTHQGLLCFNKLNIFLSPLSRDEILYLKGPERNVSLRDLVTDIMRRKLLRRTRRHKGELSARDLEEIETRASSAYRELQEAWHFEHVLPNHDGEDSDNWEAFYFPIGEARKTLEAVVGLLNGDHPPGVEKWQEGLLPPELCS
jgi:guanylate kinase